MTGAGEPGAVGPVLYSRQQIAERVTALGEQISRDYAGRVPVLVTVLKGATIFAADLARTLTIPHEMDFLAISTYSGEEGSPQARVLKDLQLSVAGRDVILVEDVIDTGLSLRFILRWLQTHDPATIAVCTLLDRPYRRLAEVEIAYRGFTVPDKFYVGYGFDYQQSYRNLPELRELAL